MLRAGLLGVVSTLACLVTGALVPVFARYTLKAGLKGKDINKKGEQDDDVPESLGIVAGIVYLVAVVLCQLLFADSIEHRLLYNAALHTVCFIVLLGFVDDVLDIPWRYKLILPAVAILPLLVAYDGVTDVLLPRIMHTWVGQAYIDLGYLYHVYMGLLAIFCTNSINILAGVNGLEIGQAIIIGTCVMIHNMIQIVDHGSESHLFSLILVCPFLGVSFGLLYWNWYPSTVFVGDTYTLFAGMTLAVCAILGHFSKTLLLFCIPQVFNFVYSLPQLIGIVHCPRHRLPMIDPKTRKLKGVPSHMNLLNLVACAFGPMHEKDLCKTILGIQALCCLFGFFVRYYLIFILG